MRRNTITGRLSIARDFDVLLRVKCGKISLNKSSLKACDLVKRSRAFFVFGGKEGENKSEKIRL